jgi:signal transduction histidine kinase
MKSLLNILTEGVIQISSDLKVIQANKAAAAILDISQEELMGREVKVLFPHKAFEKISLKDFPLKFQVNINRKELNIYFSEADKDEFFIILNDITKETSLQAQLALAQKHDFTSVLASKIGHDFNNILSGVSGNVSLILLDKGISEKLRERLEKIQSGVEAGSKFTRQLHDYSRSCLGEIVPADLNHVLMEIMYYFQKAYPSINIHMELQENLPMVDVEIKRMENAITSLLYYALSALSGVGYISVKTKSLTGDEIPENFRKRHINQYILLEVLDSAPAMDEKTREKILDLFNTTKELGLGKGVGLGSVLSFLKKCSGSIQLKSGTEKGNIFRIFIPPSRRYIHDSKRGF